MKKGVFTIMNYLMPEARRAVDALLGDGRRETGRSSLLFGLSGHRQDHALAPIPSAMLIGDDEHCWSDDGIFNIEGGCYAKAIDLTRGIGAGDLPGPALRRGAGKRRATIQTVTSTSATRGITENTRGAYPIEFIRNAKIPCVGGPSRRDVIFLTCDAFGVLPPVSRLTPAQAMYHFISGYTAKVAGTEVGVTEPQATFSPCFGGPFLVWHPDEVRRAAGRRRCSKHKANVWLVNTGWSGGGYGVGKRMKLAFTRAIIDAIHSGQLTSAPTQRGPVFGVDIITAVPNVPPEILLPRDTWADKSAYDATAASSQDYSRTISRSTKPARRRKSVRQDPSNPASQGAIFAGCVDLLAKPRRNSRLSSRTIIRVIAQQPV